MAQPFNTRRPDDENVITVPQAGLITNAPKGGYPPDANPTLINMRPNYSGQLQTRAGSDVLSEDGISIPLTDDGSVYLEKFPLSNDSYVVVCRSVRDLRIFYYDTSLEKMTITKTWFNVWPPRCRDTKLSSTTFGNLIVLACSRHVPIIVKVEELLLTSNSSTVNVLDVQERWRYSQPWAAYPDGTVEPITVSWAGTVATFTFRPDTTGQEVTIFSTLLQWGCGGKKYFGNQLYREQVRFNREDADTTLQTPTSLLTNKVVALTGSYPFSVGKPSRQQYYGIGTTDASVAGNPDLYRWTEGRHIFDGGASVVPATSPTAITFGALQGAGHAPTTLRYFRLVEVNAAPQDMCVLVQQSEDANFVRYACSSTVTGVVPSLANNTYTPFTSPNVLATGDTTTTVYKYIAFDGELACGLNKEAVAWILVKPDLMRGIPDVVPDAFTMEFHPYKNGSVFPMPGYDEYCDRIYGPGAVCAYNERLVLGQYTIAPSAITASQVTLDKNNIRALDLYSSEYGTVRFPSDSFLVEVNLTRGQTVTALIEYLQNLMVFTDSAVFRVHGGQGASAAPLSTIVEKVFFTGAYSNRAVCSGDGSIYYYGRGGLFQVFYRDQTYQQQMIGMQILSELHPLPKAPNAWVQHNDENNTLYVCRGRGAIFCYYTMYEMWSKLELGLRTDRGYGSVVANGRTIFPIVDTQSFSGFRRLYLTADHSKNGMYLDLASPKQWQGVAGQFLGLPALRVEPSIWRDDELAFAITPYGTTDLFPPNTATKSYNPLTLTNESVVAKRTEDGIHPIGVVVGNVVLTQGVDYFINVVDGYYRINMPEFPAGTPFTVGYTYPQVVETAPAVRSTYLRSKQTKVMSLVVCKAPDAISPTSIHVSEAPRSEKFTGTTVRTQPFFLEDTNLTCESVSLGMQGYAPTAFIWSDFTASGFCLDSYQYFVEANERRNAGGV